MASDETNFKAGLLKRAAVSSIGFFLLLAAILFVPAGFGWRRGLIFYLIFIALMVSSAAYLWRKNPDVFVARSKIHKGGKSWDKVLLALILASFFAIFMVAGLDARYGWSYVPDWLLAAGYVLLLVGFVMSTWVYSVNKFAEPIVRIQVERGHKVIDTGPYAIIRHPLYLASFVLIGGTALALGSYWALIPVAVGCVVLIVRTLLEDRTLQNELEGYKDYASRVRYRLIPGIW